MITKWNMSCSYGSHFKMQHIEEDILSDFLHYLPCVFTLANITVLLVGTFGGLILGAMPGLSPTMAVALLVPFTFHMEPATGLILLGAVYTSTIAGGAISAILINIPGAPSNIATMFDGHPMAKQGKAKEALYTCFISSFAGGLFGMFMMILFTPVLSDLTMKFGPSELFWISIFGITIMAGLSSGSIVKGLFGGALGLIFSTIGYSPTLGVPRFVFHDSLTGGIAIIPALIGLFAIPQALRLVEEFGVTRKAAIIVNNPGLLMKTIKKHLGWTKQLTIGSLLGSVIGIIPGAGGQVAGLIAYDQAKKLSKTPETFGKGNPEGIVAAESANNAMVGPSLIPMLTMGIPGSPTAAVLLGGLLIHGLFPGPDLFVHYAEETYTFIGSLVIGQIAMAVLGLALARFSPIIMKVSSLAMMGGVTVLAIFGTYSVQNSMDDVLVMLCLGILMYIGSKFNFSAAPVVLGVILGPIAEINFVKGKMIAMTDVGVFNYFFSGGISIGIIICCLLSIGWSIWSEIQFTRKMNAKTN